MKINLRSGKFPDIDTELAVVGMFEGEKPDRLKQLDSLLRGEISAAIQQKRFTGEAKQFLTIATLGAIKPKHLMLAGLGKKEKFDLEQLRRAAAESARAVREFGIRHFTTMLHTLPVARAAEADKVFAVAEATHLGTYQFLKYKTQELEKIKRLDAMDILCSDARAAQQLAPVVRKAGIIAEGTNYARDLTNTPAMTATPLFLVQEARNAAKEHRLKLTVFGRKELKKHGMNAILAVGAGSQHEQRFVILEYHGAPAKKEKIALVGKGITFDSGGLNLKPGDYMETMQIDMTGAGMVLAIIKTAAALKLRVNVIAAFPAVENMPSGSSYKPGDIIKTYSGKTIEIKNTDAEGRVVLSDALAYVDKNYAPQAIIDVATLTGAAVSAMGYDAAPFFSTDDALAAALEKSSKNTGEKLWRMPLFDDFADIIRSDAADMINVGRLGYAGGLYSGTVLLKNFVGEKTPWAHLDIAGPAHHPEGRGYVPKHGTGFGVRLLLNFLEEKAKRQ